MIVRKIKDGEIAFVVELWERSVIKTHPFVGETERLEMKATMPKILAQTSCYVVIDDAEQILGFAGVSETSLDMLFIDDNSIGTGAGGYLFDTVLALNPAVNELEVNVENEHAKSFYEYKGFCVVSRQEVDDEGRQFPIYLMQRKK